VQEVSLCRPDACIASLACCPAYGHSGAFFLNTPRFLASPNCVGTGPSAQTSQGPSGGLLRYRGRG
jgi:hypothetical protein